LRAHEFVNVKELSNFATLKPKTDKKHISPDRATIYFLHLQAGVLCILKERVIFFESGEEYMAREAMGAI
jgi:hypothetical protein